METEIADFNNVCITNTSETVSLIVELKKGDPWPYRSQNPIILPKQSVSIPASVLPVIRALNPGEEGSYTVTKWKE